MQLPQQYGTTAIENFALRVLDLANVDKNNDGKVDATEWGRLVFGLVPELLNIKQLNNEVRDLTVSEIADIIEVVGKNFPNYRNLRDEVEEVIRLALALLANATRDGYALILAIKALNKTPLNIEPAKAPKTEAAPAKSNTEAKKAKTAGTLGKDQPGKTDEPAESAEAEEEKAL